MTKPKVFIYEKAQAHAHDSIPEYRGFVPMSHDGIRNHCEIVTDPDKADIFYMGQFSCGNRKFLRSDFPYYEKSEKVHLADIEGDWEHENVSSELLRSAIVSINCAKSEYLKHQSRMFVRPTFSRLLAELVSGKRHFEFEPNVNRKFSFRGQLDPAGTRLKTAQACEHAKIRHDIHFNSTSFSRAVSGNPDVEKYCQNLSDNSFALCPRGVGKDTIRYFEACAMGRIPVVVSNIELFQEKNFEPFWFKISDHATTEDIANLLTHVSRLPDEEIVRRQSLAHEYFNTLVLEYFNDPTEMFLKWVNSEASNGV
jgi:hypothetical protein